MHRSASTGDTENAVPSPEAMAAEISAGLRQMGDPARARGAQQYFKNEIIALGVTTPALRDFMKQRVRGIRNAWSLRDAIRLCDRLLREPEMEIRGAGILGLAAFRGKLAPELLPHADGWLGRRLDNWALVDLFCGSVLDPLLEGYPETEVALAGWSAAESLWRRRASLVTLVPSARRGRRLDLAYRLAREHFGDGEDLMHKATGWLLREAGKTDVPRLKRFLLEHGPAIPRTALRYAIERYDAAERAALLAATRGRTTPTGRRE